MNPPFSISSALTIALLTPGLSAQTPGSFTTFGTGCSGTGGPLSLSVTFNPACAIPALAELDHTWVIKLPGNDRRGIGSVSFLTQTRSGSSAPVTVSIWETDAQGEPLRFIASTQTTATSSAAMRTASFAGAIPISAGTHVGIGFAAPNARLPICGSAATLVPSFVRPNGAPNWSAVPNVPWKFDVNCSALSAPDLRSSGTPETGGSFSLTMVDALPRATAAFCFGGSRTNWLGIPLPLDLGLINAPGCALRTAWEANSLVMVDHGGRASIQLAIPNNPALAGFELFTQGLVLDPAANGLGLALTQGGRALIGEPCVDRVLDTVQSSFDFAVPTLAPVITTSLGSISVDLMSTREQRCCGDVAMCHVDAAGTVSGSLNQHIPIFAPFATVTRLTGWACTLIRAVTGGSVDCTTNVGIWADGIDVTGSLQGSYDECTQTSSYGGSGDIALRNFTSGADLSITVDLPLISFDYSLSMLLDMTPDAGWTLDDSGMSFFFRVPEVTPSIDVTIPGIGFLGPWSVVGSTTLDTSEFEVVTPPIPFPDFAFDLSCN